VTRRATTRTVATHRLGREQQLELLAGELDRPSVHRHLVTAGVDDEPADGDHRVLVRLPMRRSTARMRAVSCAAVNG
jgi:hypothetical protein